MSIPWTTVEDAIYDWVSSASGVSVIWSHQSGPRPDGAYVSLRVLSVVRTGLDGIFVQDAENPQPGEEIDIIVRGDRRMTVSMQCFAGVDGDDETNQAVGASSPHGILSNVVLRATLPSRRQALVDAGIGVASFTDVQSLEGTVRGILEPRALVSMDAFLSEKVSEPATYIERVEVTRTNTGDTNTLE